MFRTAATKIAHNSTLPSLGGNKDLKPLQDLITAEKTVLISLQRLSGDFGKAAEALRNWGQGEGDDLGDTLTASTGLLNHFSAGLSQYAAHEHAMREHLKGIRTREEALDELKRRRKVVAMKAETAERKLSKMSPEHKNLPMQKDALNKLRDEIRTMDSDILTEEAALGDFKRSTTRAWMGLKFGGLLECCERGTIAGEFGKLVIAEIPEEITQPGFARSLYYGHPKTQSLVSEAQECIGKVALSVVPTSQPRQRNQNPQGGNLPPLPSNAPMWSPPPGPPPGNSAQFQPPTGHFMDTPGSPSINSHGTPTSQQYPQSTPFYPQIEPHQPTNRSVDDFGTQVDSSGNLGGRFATFPVKNRAPGAPGGSGFPPHEPPSLNARHEADQSFSSSIFEAFDSSKTHAPNPNPGVKLAEPGSHFSVESSLPPYVPTYAPPPGPPPGAAAGAGIGHQWSDNPIHQQPSGDFRKSQNFDDDAGLAYMTDDIPHDHHSSERHVRFGEVSDVEEELEHRAWQQEQAARISQEHQNQDGSVPPTPTPGGVVGAGQPRGDNRFQNQQRVPPPPVNPQEDERALNAAAAREISRELDALHFNPPSPLHPNQPPPPNNIYGGPAPDAHTNMEAPDSSQQHTPLVPPSAPFSARTVSPYPSDGPGGFPGYNPQSQPLPPNTQEYTQAPFEAGGESPQPTNQPTSPQPPQMTPQRSQDASASPLSSAPHRASPDYPRGLGSSPITKPLSPSNSPAPTGTRTISAAAFKRPPPRMASGNDQPGLPDTNPLSLKKRLPSSPYPQRAAATPSSLSQESSPNANRDRSGSAPANQPSIGADGDDDQFDYISAYVNNNLQNDEENYDGRGHPNTQGAPPSPGYGEGRFATDLEGGGLR